MALSRLCWCHKVGRRWNGVSAGSLWEKQLFTYIHIQGFRKENLRLNSVKNKSMGKVGCNWFWCCFTKEILFDKFKSWAPVCQHIITPWHYWHTTYGPRQANLVLIAYASSEGSVSPEPPLLAHTGSESRGTFRQKPRSLPPLNGWTCAVEICHDGMLEDTNSLDGAHMTLVFDVNDTRSTPARSNKKHRNWSENFPAAKSKKGLNLIPLFTWYE